MKTKNASAVAVLAAATIAGANVHRQDELATARTKYLTATQSAKAGGGSSFVGKVAREIAETGKVYGNLTDLAKALRTIDPVKALAKADEIIIKMKSTIEPDPKTNKPANTPTKQTVEARAAFASFLGVDAVQNLTDHAAGKTIGTNRYNDVADALDTFQKHSAFTYAETFKDKTGAEHTRPVDVRDDANSLYGFKVTAKVRLAGRATFA